MTRLETRKLVFDYPGPVRALAGVDLTLGAEELLVVLGPNGSGKSTLLRCLSGLESPTSGEVLLSGRPLESTEIRERARKIAVVPQYLPALPDVRVDDFVLGGRYCHFRRFRGAASRDLQVAREALEAADATGIESRFMSELSGGQRQRVLFARAVAQEAEVLLIDEPTSSLDPEHQIGVFVLIEKLIGEGRSVVVVTHDLNLASQFARRVVLLEAGVVVKAGRVEEVLRREVLEPVYGPHLYYGRLAGRDGRERPFALPWLERP